IKSEPKTAPGHHGFMENVMTIHFAQFLHSGDSKYRFLVQAVQHFTIRITEMLFESLHQAVLSSNHYSQQWEILQLILIWSVNIPLVGYKSAHLNDSDMPDFSQSKSPTVLSPPPRMARAAADLAEQIKKERYEYAREIGRGGMG